MLKFLWLLFIISPAEAQVVQAGSYLIYPSQAACLQRSKQMCTVMGCDGVHAIYWWPCDTGPLSAGLVGPSAVTSGSYAMAIQSSGPFGATTSNQVSGGTQGLTAQEQSSMVTATAIAPVLPVATSGTQAIP